LQKDRFGWTTFSVMERKDTSATVLMEAGAFTTVDTMKMSLYPVLVTPRQQVRRHQCRCPLSIPPHRRCLRRRPPFPSHQTCRLHLEHPLSVPSRSYYRPRVLSLCHLWLTPPVSLHRSRLQHRVLYRYQPRCRLLGRLRHLQ